MYQHIECQDRYWIINLSDSVQWDGVGYPNNAKSVWACLLSNAKELEDLRAFWKKIQDSVIIDDGIVI